MFNRLVRSALPFIVITTNVGALFVLDSYVVFSPDTTQALSAGMSIVTLGVITLASAAVFIIANTEAPKSSWTFRHRLLLVASGVPVVFVGVLWVYICARTLLTGTLINFYPQIGAEWAASMELFFVAASGSASGIAGRLVGARALLLAVCLGGASVLIGRMYGQSDMIGFLFWLLAGLSLIPIVFFAAKTALDGSGWQWFSAVYIAIAVGCAWLGAAFDPAIKRDLFVLLDKQVPMWDIPERFRAWLMQVVDQPAGRAIWFVLFGLFSFASGRNLADRILILFANPIDEKRRP